MRSYVYSHWLWRRYTRPTALARAGFRCEAEDAVDGRCRATGRDLHVHHTDGGVKAIIARGGDPFDPDGCEVYCPSHHSELEWLVRR